jgi:sec-independent protein translocase protein TatC
MVKTKNPKGEMPFLEHLEELRWRILRSLGAVLVGTVIGFLAVQNFEVLELLKQPIAPYLPDGRLVVTRPTDAFFVTLKLAFLIGLLLGAPVLLREMWAFLSPALYEHEKQYITPALLAGLGLFAIGALMAYLWVLPVALRILLTKFQMEDLEFFITATAYFGFATQLIIAFGLMFEVPLFMVLLSSLGLIGPAGFAKQRPLALVIASILAAMLTPPDVASMMMLMLPVVLLYEVGILVSRLVWKRRERSTAEQ